jgi:integrase
MATVTFYIQSDTDRATIHCYFSVGRGKLYKRKTREFISPKHWNNNKKFPIELKSGTAEVLKQNGDLRSRLNKMQDFILDQYRERSDSDIINGEWLEEIITAFYSGGRKLKQLDYLEFYLKYYREEVLPFRKHRGKLITPATVAKQKTIINKIQEFLDSLNQRLKVSDYDLKMSNKFELFLEKQGIGKGTIGRYVKYPKTIIGYATSIDIQVSKTLSDVKGYTTKTPTIYITEDELESISQITFLDPKLEAAKDWLIIGFYTGQRGGDLLKMNKGKLIEREGRKCLNLSQKKTVNPVLIPLKRQVLDVLAKRNGDFPDRFSDNIESAKTIFNRKLRIITEQAKLSRLEYGKKWNKEAKKFIYGEYPLHEIISSHVCRRSFATHNYAKMPTPIVMAVTGHKTEKEFLNYIGKDFNDLSMQMFGYWDKEDEKKEYLSEKIN